jgi:hypothetical protein
MTEDNALLRRLTQQTGSRSLALKLLTRRGHMKNGKLTAAGRKRQALGNAGRAKDRAAKRYGGSPSDYTYNSRTNRATKNVQSHHLF